MGKVWVPMRMRPEGLQPRIDGQAPWRRPVAKAF